MPTATYDIETVLEHWTPEPVVIEGLITPEPAYELAALLGVDAVEARGELRPMWHEVYLRENFDVGDLGADGHPAVSGLVPPVLNRQRIFGGGRLEVLAPLTIGVEARRSAEVASTRLVAGKSGPMLVLTERHLWFVGDRLYLREHRDLVYRAVQENLPLDDDRVASMVSEQPGAFVPTEHVLAGYSNLTANGHRIHYDRRYAQQVEHHADLLVHGPLTALLAAEAVHRDSLRPPRTFEFRLTAPAYVDRPISFAVTESLDRASNSRQVRGLSSGTLCLQGEACF